MFDLSITVASGDHVLRNKGHKLYLKDSDSSAVFVGFTHISVKLRNLLPNKFYTLCFSVFKHDVIKLFIDRAKHYMNIN